MSDIRLGYHRFNLLELIIYDFSFVRPSLSKLIRLAARYNLDIWVVICDHGTRVLIFVFSYLFHELLKLAKYNLKILNGLAVHSAIHTQTNFFRKKLCTNLQYPNKKETSKPWNIIEKNKAN